MDYLLDLILIPMQVIIVIYTVYYFVLAVIGMWRSRVHKNYTPKNSFAIVVCAHNEEAVVGELVKNLRSLDYPDELYDIFVVADNCTDKTAEVASAAGANVHERFNKEEVGKGIEARPEARFDRFDSLFIGDCRRCTSNSYFYRRMCGAGAVRGWAAFRTVSF